MSRLQGAETHAPAKLLYLPTRTKWRAWLRKHYQSESEVWLVFPRASSGKPRISYNDAVEEALCFGWIDSTVRSVDNDNFAQRFSIRRQGSKYSQADIERLRFLLSAGKVARDIRRTLPNLALDNFKIAKDLSPKRSRPIRRRASTSAPFLGLHRWVRESLRLDAGPASMAMPYYVDRPQGCAAGWAMN